jgi:hypothetical protein
MTLIPIFTQCTLCKCALGDAHIDVHLDGIKHMWRLEVEDIYYPCSGSMALVRVLAYNACDFNMDVYNEYKQ